MAIVKKEFTLGGGGSGAGAEKIWDGQELILPGTQSENLKWTNIKHYRLITITFFQAYDDAYGPVLTQQAACITFDTVQWRHNSTDTINCPVAYAGYQGNDSFYQGRAVKLWIENGYIHMLCTGGSDLISQQISITRITAVGTVDDTEVPVED